VEEHLEIQFMVGYYPGVTLKCLVKNHKLLSRENQLSGSFCYRVSHKCELDQLQLEESSYFRQFRRTP